MMKRIFPIVILMGFWACTNSLVDHQKELEKAKEEIKELKKQLQKEKEDDGAGELVHVVFFQLKENLDEGNHQKFETELESLGQVKSTQDVEVGTPIDTGDKRLISDYDYVLVVEFNNLEDLKKYATDSFHMEVRSRVGGMLAKTPIVYDFWVD